MPADAAAGGLRTFNRVMQAWNIEDEVAMRLLGCPRATFYRWRKNPETARLSQDTLERLSYIFGIYKDLHILLPKKEAADSWVQRPNSTPLFGGQPPINRMRAGHVADLYVVRSYLDARRGGWA